ncbi:MAG: GIY-YIG nuclease family protein [Proteobacteria bacterium]|nr:MAG: GIY-YIG nuclease family protein [Pseudomonadota bacterium]QKK12378.1 MAG: GIY-YIG nuclease family protein [Pseudomonadota bacterium]
MQRIFPPEFTLAGNGNSRPGDQAYSLNSGAYRLIVALSRPACITPGCLGRLRLAPGRYCYLGSARRGLHQRVARHLRVASGQSCGGHWHIDALLMHRHARVVAVDLVPQGDECELSLTLAAAPGTSVPIAGFGATDCRCGCPAHLYRLSSDIASP